MAKLSKSQLDVIIRMQEPYNEQLRKSFPSWMSKPPTYWLYKSESSYSSTKVKQSTAEALQKKGLVEVSKIDMSGTTTHYFKLTEAGKKIKE